MMSEKRFKTLTIIIEDDTGTVQTHIRSELSAPQLMDNIFKLKEKNEQLKEENKKLIEEWEFSFRTEMAHHRFAEKELQEKIREKQATIQSLKEENEQLKQKIQRWKNLYEIKDAEVTARVDALNKVCEYYTSEVLFKSDTDPNRAVKEVLNEILNTEVKK